MIVDGTASVSGASTLTGAVTASSTLGVTGAATLSSTLAVTGATTLSSTLDVTGASTLNDIKQNTTSKLVIGGNTILFGSELPHKLQMAAQFVGVALLGLIMIVAFYNDFVRIFS